MPRLPLAALQAADPSTTAAPLVVLDPESLRVRATRFVEDLPAGGSRLVHEAEGYHAVIVGGQVLLRNGEPTGARPGRVLRRATAG